MKRIVASFLLVLLLSPLAALAQKPPMRVRFPKGRTTAILRGRTTGDVDRYLLNARAGQQMTVHITSPSRGIAADIWMPNSQSVVDGGRETTDWSGTLPSSGDCWIVVSTVGNSRGGPYTLEVTIR